jgi:hypothetical protein
LGTHSYFANDKNDYEQSNTHWVKEKGNSAEPNIVEADQHE